MRKSKIKNQKSKIKNQKSKIKNQKSKLRIDKHLSLVFLILFLMLAACGKGSVASLDAFLKINKNKLSNFIGIKSLNRSADGSYVLYWDHPTNLSDISKISYKIYLSKWSSIPGAAISDSAVLTSEEEGTLVKSQAIQLDSSESPVGKGALLSSLAGARSYKLDFPLKNDVIYAFQVIASLPDEPSDNNQRVLIYDPSSNLLGFEGISGLSIADGGFLKLNWKAPSLAGILPDQIKYSIYVSTTKQAVDTLVSAATLVDTIKIAGQAQVVDVAESVLPSLEQPTSAVQTGGSSYTFNKVFPLGVTYLFEVRALGPAGEIDNNRRIIVYRRSKLNFAGLSVNNAVLASDAARIDLSWSAAIGGSGKVSYEVYDNAELTSAIGQTNELSFSISNPTPGRLYTLGVRAKDDSGFDDNSQVITVAVPDTRDRLAPSFAGLVSATAASDKKILLSWAASPSTDLFKYNIYRSNNLSTPIASSSSTSYLVSGLSPGTSYTFIVRALDTSGNEDTNSVQKSATTQSQSVPDFAGLGSAATLSDTAGLTGVNLVWTAATGAVTGYRIYMASSAGAENFSSPSTGATGMTTSNATIGAYIAGQYTTSATVTGLTQGTSYYFVVRAFYWDGTSVRSESNLVERSVTTVQAQAPSFAGISSVTTPISVSGFSQLQSSWSPIASGDLANFSYYEIAWATTANGINWSSATQISNATASTYTIVGLSPNTTYFVAVRAVNATGSSPVSDGGEVKLSGTTTPLAAQGDNFSAVSSPDPTSMSLSYSSPSATASVGGLYNNLFLFVYQGTTTQLANFYTASVPIVTASITASLAAGSVTLASAPTSGAIIQVSPGQFTAGAANTFTIAGINPNQQTCVKLVAAYWVNGSYYLPAQAPTSRCVTPIAAAPVFAGVSSLSGAGDQSDFSLITANWGSITGSCSSLDVSISTSSASANFTTASFPAFKNLSCALSSVNISGLARNTTYFIQVRAKYLVNSVAYSSGQDVELSKTTVPTSPSGDGVSAVSLTDQSKGTPTAAVSWSLPSAGVWNKVFLWRASGNDQATATAAVRAAAATNVGFTGPTSAPLVQYNVASPAANTTASYADNSGALTRGPYWCYLMRAVYDDGVFYNASANQTVQCGVIASTPMSFNGMSSSNSLVSSTWSDGTAKIKLQFTSPPSGNADEFWVYYSPNSNLANFDLTNAPWQIVDNTAVNAYNSGYPTPGFIYVGGQGRTFSGDGYYLVRAVRYGSTDIDSNTAISNLVSIPAAQSNYVYVSTSVSRLSYPYWIGTYEASLASGSLGSDTVSATETNLQSCSYQFHVNGVAKHANCGSFASTGVAQSVSGVSPVSATWHQAWTACRNATTLGAVGSTGATSSAGNLYARLPSETEWRRASRWAANNYANQWTVYSGGAGNCNTASGSLANTGAGSSCISSVNAFDMAGNQREWVDQRMTMYDISSNSESRFSYGPQIGRLLANGIEIQASGVNSPVTRRYHNITPGANNLGLLMGSDYATSGYTYQKQYDAETESWQDPTLSTATGTAARGFRCVAFPSSLYRPTMAQLAQVSEPTYSTADIPGSPTPTAAQALTWKIPENFYVKDARPESVSHVLSYFPNTTNLAVWPLNGASSGDQSDISGNGKTLTLNGTLSSSQGLDGQSYMNTFNGTNTYFSSTDTMFASTSSFTMGGWVYRPDWTIAAYQRILARVNTDGTQGYFLGFGNSSYGSTSSSTPWICIGEYGNCVISWSHAGLSPGWHHIIAVRGSATDHRLYVDGVQVGSTNNTWTITNGSWNFLVGTQFTTSFYFSGRMANVFFHAGIGYTAQQVQRLSFGSMVNTTPYASSTMLANSDGIKISWSPWTKQSCTSSCSSSVDTGFTYYIYRYIEPTKVDIRPRTPWAIQHGPYASLPSALSGANATAMPMDPLATDSSGNLLCSNSSSTTPMCTHVATISGSTCNSSASTACTFTDSAALSNGFSTTAIYNYIMVVRDAEGNYQVPRVQRYRSPYFVGDPSSTASSAFRTEQRWRRASLFLVDEAYQQLDATRLTVQPNPQIMSYVPMDVSGLDHDFFIHKYEAQSYSGSISNNVTSNGTSSSTWPLQGSGTDNTWSSKAGACYENFWRTGTISAALCGDGATTNNATSTVVQSKQGVSPLASIDQGALWKACNNTGVIDGSGNIYYLNLASDAEWLKAADWGDVAQQGTVTQSIFGLNIGQTVSSLESSNITLSGTATTGSNTITGISSTTGAQIGQLAIAYNYTNSGTVSSFTSNSVTLSVAAVATGTASLILTTTGSCNTESGAAVSSNSSQTLNCRSRFGVADHVGNVWDYTNGQYYSGVGYDNGVDGLLLSQGFPTSTTSLSAFGGKYDLLRGVPKASNAPTVSHNSDTISYTSALGAALRGGYRTSSSANGRWSWNPTTPSFAGSSVGGRCSR